VIELYELLRTAKTAHDKKLIQRQIDAIDKQIDQLVFELYGLTDKGDPHRRGSNEVMELTSAGGTIHRSASRSFRMSAYPSPQHTHPPKEVALAREH